MPTKTLRIATIGTWGHLGDPLSEIAAMPDAKVIAHARATDQEDIANVRRLTGDPSLPWFDDYQQMLRETRPDVVIISSRIDRNNPIAMDVANAGCHIICEKPLAISHADLRRLFDATQANKVQCVAMLGNGRHPVMQAAAGIIQSGQAGEVVLMNARKSYKWGDNRPDWFADPKAYGGTIPWIGIHGLEMIRILSNQDFVSVSAMQSNRVHTERPACQDNGVIIVGLSGGGHASVSFDYLRPPGASTHGDDWVRVVCSRGVIEASFERGWCKFISNTEPECDIPLPSRGKFFEPFLRGIANAGGKPMVETLRSFMLTHVALVARDAADRKTVEPISQVYLQS